MSELYVLQPDGTRFGPLTKDAIARGILDGTIAQDAYLAPPGAPQWFHASQLPAVTALVESLRRSASSVPPPRPASQPPRYALKATLESPIAPPISGASPIKAPRTDPQVLSAQQTQPQPAVMEQLAAMTVVSPRSPAVAQGPSAAAKSTGEKWPEPKRPAGSGAPPVQLDARVETESKAVAKPPPEVGSTKAPWPRWLPFGIFGAFALIALGEVVVAVVAPAPRGDIDPTQTIETKR